MRSTVLFIGMYGITVTLFWVESGSVTTGLTFGLLSASLKTVWANVHNRYYQEAIREEIISITEYRKSA